MITTTTKNEIFNKLQFYYSHTKFSINGLQYTTFKQDYNNESEFEQALYKVNTQIFFRDLIARRGKIIDGVSIEIIKDIPEIIKTEYRLFSRNKTKAENENWLNHTYNFIININDLSRFIGKSDTVAFLDWYDTMIIKQPEYKAVQDEPKKELHNNIFVGNSFEVWELYRINKNITVNSATDLRVIFELMKKDTLIVETAELKHYITWLNKFYFKNNLTTLRTQNLKSNPNIQRANDYKEYKKTTLKTP
jgi:hypothetical protein